VSVRRRAGISYASEYNSETPKSMDIYCRSDQIRKKKEKKKKERKLTNELQSIWDGICVAVCVKRERKKKSSRRRREESETMPTCVLLSRRFIGMLSRVSRILVSRRRREPGTWENFGFSASTKLYRRGFS